MILELLLYEVVTTAGGYPVLRRSREALMVKALLEEATLPEKAKSALDSSKKWARQRLLKPVDEFINTVNGEQVLKEVREYMTESEAINTALVTRLLQAEGRIRWLQGLVAILVVAEVMHWLLR